MVQIREMKPGDTEEVAALEREIFSQPWSRQGFLDALGMDCTIFLVAEEAGQILGYAGLYAAPGEGEITNVAVAPRARGRGLGGLLVAALKERAEESGLTRLVLEVRVSNGAAIRLYERSGFVRQGVRRGFYERPKEDAYIMVYGQ